MAKLTYQESKASLVDKNTVQELIELVRNTIELVRNTKAEPISGAKGTIFNSGFVKMPDGTTVHSSVVAEQIKKSAGSALSNINDTDASKLIQDSAFRDKLRQAAVKEGKDFDAILDGATNTSGTRTSGLWDDVSKELARNASGDIYVVTPDAEANRVFRQTELSELINNPKINTIDGIPRQAYKSIHDSAVAAGKTSSQALDDVYKSMQQVNKIKLNEIKQYTDVDGSTKIALTKEYLGPNSGVTPSQIPSGAKNIKSYANTVEHLTDDAIKSLGKVAVHGGKVLGPVMTVLDVGFAVAEAKGKADAGDFEGAAKTLIEGLGGGVGGFAMSSAGLALGAAMIATGGVGVAAGLIISAALAIGGYAIGSFGGEQAVKNLIKAAEDFGLLAEGALEQLGKDFDAVMDAASALAHELGLDQIQLPQWLKDLISKFDNSEAQASPLILDLNKNGAIDLVSLANSKAYFDIDGDGYAEKTGWVAPSDGLLVFDRNGDGAIRGNGELFGTKAEEGFGVLAALDTNKDGKIGAGDTDFAKLRVWVDGNGDGVSQQGELKTLASLGIASINLANTRVAETVQGNFITNDGTFTYTNGTTGRISDVWFSYDEANSVYDRPYTLDTRTLFLPTARGYGELADLHIAMSIDNGAGGLLEMVQAFSQRTSTSIFRDTTLMDDIKAILFRWAGVQALDPASRGSSVDARELAFLEKLTGQDFLQGGYSSNPRVQAGKILATAFDDAAYAIFGRIALQSFAKDMFAGNTGYDFAKDSFGTLGALNAAYINQLKTGAAGFADKLSYWENVLSLVIGVKGAAGITGADISVLDAAIKSTDASLSYTVVNDHLFADVTKGISLSGDANANTLNGTTRDDTIKGAAGNDTINGGYGMDILHGGMFGASNGEPAWAA